MAVTFIPQHQIHFPNNALLDFAPVTSALQNWQQQEERDRQFGFHQQQLGMAQRRLGMEEALHPGALALQGVQTEAQREALRHGRVVNPLGERREVVTTEEAEAEHRAMERWRALTGGVGGRFDRDTAGRSDVTPLAQAAPTPTAGAPPPQSAAVTPPVSGITVTPPIATTAPSGDQSNFDADALGRRFAQDWLLNHPNGENNFSHMRAHPFFADAITQHNLHQLPWREAAEHLAGVNGISVTPTTQPAADGASQTPVLQPAPVAQSGAPTAPPAQINAQTPPPSPQSGAPLQRVPASPAMSERAQTATAMINSGSTALRTQGVAMLAEINKPLLEHGLELGRDPDGVWRIGAVPNYAEADARLHGMRRTATAPADIIVSAAQQGGRPIAVVPGQSVTTGSQIDANQAAALAWALQQSGITPPPAAGTQGPPAQNTQPPPPPTAPAAQPGAPPAQHNLSTVTPFPTGLHRNPDGSLSTIQTAEHAEMQKQLAERFHELRSSAEGAGVTQQRLASMEEAFRRLNAEPGLLNTGAGAGLRQTIAEVLSTISTSVGGQPIAADRIADLQQLNKEMVTLGFAVARSVGGNRVLASEVTAAMRGVPTSGNSAQGALTVLNLLRQSSQHDIDQYQFTQQWLLQHGTTFGADTAFVQQNPPQLYVARGLNQARYNIGDNDIANLQANRGNPQFVAEWDRAAMARNAPPGLSRLYLQNGRPPAEFMPGSGNPLTPSSQGGRQNIVTPPGPQAAPPPQQQPQPSPTTQTQAPPEQVPPQQAAAPAPQQQPTPWQPPARPPGPQQARQQAQQAIAAHPSARAEVLNRMRKMGYSVWGL